VKFVDSFFYSLIIPAGIPYGTPIHANYFFYYLV